MSTVHSHATGRRTYPKLELGHKFETLSLLPRPWDDASRDYIESRPQHYVNNYEQYISVVRTGIGDLRLVLGGEVDAGIALPD